MYLSVVMRAEGATGFHKVGIVGNFGYDITLELIYVSSYYLISSKSFFKTDAETQYWARNSIWQEDCPAWKVHYWSSGILAQLVFLILWWHFWYYQKGGNRWITVRIRVTGNYKHYWVRQALYQTWEHWGAAETMSHCIINKQMACDSSYIICPFPDFNWLIKSLATFGLAQKVLI